MPLESSILLQPRHLKELDVTQALASCYIPSARNSTTQSPSVDSVVTLSQSLDTPAQLPDWQKVCPGGELVETVIRSGLISEFEGERPVSDSTAEKDSHT
ncbi:MAG: hypothetical protein DHS20C16_06310 [Phycisphaerae bacterium]|nr:MAG: hypothetical protein DHS20C16_06310 [Phycisphaerae bacterium]